MGKKSSDAKLFVYKNWFPLVSFILFGAVYMLYFFYVKTALIESSSGADMRVVNYAKLYGPYVGFVVGLIFMLAIYILYLIKKILFLGKIYILNLLFLLLSYGTIAYLGYWLVYYEPRTTGIAIGIIDFTGKPLLYSGIIVSAIILLLFSFQTVFYFIKNRKGNIEKAQ
ncbi:MAG: hypothetical protein V3575_00230 [Candidatus Absconditabacteria bacterium]